jgi:hypothetical protein
MIFSIIIIFLFAVYSAVFSAMQSLYSENVLPQDRAIFAPPFAKTESFFRSCGINLIVGALSAAVVSGELAKSQWLQCLLVGNLIFCPVLAYMLADDDEPITRQTARKVVFYAIIGLTLFVVTVAVATSDDTTKTVPISTPKTSDIKATPDF